MLFFITECFWLLDALLQYATTTHIPPIFEELKSDFNLESKSLPQRMEGIIGYSCKTCNILSISVLKKCLLDVWIFFKSILLVPLLRGAKNVRTREGGLGEILINNLKTENKWKFPLTGVNFYKH